MSPPARSARPGFPTTPDCRRLAVALCLVIAALTSLAACSQPALPAATSTPITAVTTVQAQEPPAPAIARTGAGGSEPAGLAADTVPPSAHTSHAAPTQQDLLPAVIASATATTPAPEPPTSPATEVAVALAPPLLPDLVPMVPYELFVGQRWDGTRVLYFDTSLYNAGPGPLLLVADHDAAAEISRAVQVVRLEDGSETERLVGVFIYHPTHDHWHFEEFSEFELFTHAPDGTLLERLATTGKVSFCIMDAWMIPSPPEGTPDIPAIAHCWGDVQGLSVGWADTYDSTVEGQELDLTGIPDGRYALRQTVDPANLIHEADETNNTVTIYVQLTGYTIRVLPGPG